MHNVQLTQEQLVYLYKIVSSETEMLNGERTPEGIIDSAANNGLKLCRNIQTRLQTAVIDTLERGELNNEH